MVIEIVTIAGVRRLQPAKPPASCADCSRLVALMSHDDSGVSSWDTAVFESDTPMNSLVH